MKNENSFDIEYRVFLVDERPYCVWDTNFKSKVFDFLESLDPEYYEFLANKHIKGILSKNKKTSKYSSLALRTAYSQALETFFALISSCIQAPNCPHAWFTTYKNIDLENIVRKIHNKQALTTQLKNSTLNWKNISDALLQSLNLSEKEKEAMIKNGFAKLWSKLATDFLDKGFSDEYNSIKHGLRIRHGGFSIAVGKEESSNMQLLGKSEFGSSYITSERYKLNTRHIQIMRNHRNWHPEDFGWGLLMLSISIKNLISTLKIMNGINPKKVKYYWPNDLSTMTKPWEQRKIIGVTSMSGLQANIPEEFIQPFSESKILELYKQGQLGGVMEIVFPSTNESS
jgi:hypothetical protein